MLVNIKSLTGFTLRATDGEVGEVKDFLFDDQTWTIRYMIVETGNWLSGRKVLISTESVDRTDSTSNMNHKVFPVNLSKEQILHSPPIDPDKPITRMQEEELNGHYPWNNYWQSGYFTTGMIAYNALPLEDEIKIRGEEQHSYRSEHESHLQSVHKIMGDTIKETDGDLGTIQGFIIDDSSWKIKFIILDIGTWFSGKKVVISPQSITNVDWPMSEIRVNLTKDAVKHSPQFDESEPIPADLEDYFNLHYGSRE